MASSAEARARYKQNLICPCPNPTTLPSTGCHVEAHAAKARLIAENKAAEAGRLPLSDAERRRMIRAAKG